MSSLSSRLRETNARLQKLETEQKGMKGRYETLSKMLHVLNLLWHKDGFKDGRDFCLNSGAAEKELGMIFRLEPKAIKSIFQVLSAEKVFTSRTDQYNNAVLATQNRAAIGKFADFIDAFVNSFKDLTCFPQPAIDLMSTLVKLVGESAYDTVNVPLDDIMIEGERQSLDVSKWKDQLVHFRPLKDTLQLVKVSSNQVGFRAVKKELPQFVANHRVLAALAKAGLDR